MMAMHRGPQNDLPCTQLCRASYSNAVRTTLPETYHLPSCLQTEPPPIIATTLPPTSPHETSLCQQPNAFEQLKTLWFEMQKSFLNSMDDNHICRVCIPLCNPKYFDCKIFNQLQQDIEHFSLTGSVVLGNTLILSPKVEKV